MSNRAATILAIAAVISSLCIYAAFAQAPEPEADAAIFTGTQAIRFQQELPGRYQMTTLDKMGWVVLLDSHTGECWYGAPTASWRGMDSPVKRK